MKQFVSNISDLWSVCEETSDHSFQRPFAYSASASTFAIRALPITHFRKNSLLVDHTNRQLISTLDDLSSLLGRHVVGDLSAVRGVVHHQELQVLHVAHDELVQSVGEHVLGGGVGTVTNVGHQSGTTEATSAAAINTLGLSPVLLIA